MKKIKLILILFLIYSGYLYPQAGKNIRLINNVNPLSSTTSSWQFSAIWGYKASDGREYAILGSTNATYFIDITDSLNVRVVDSLPAAQNQSIIKETKVYSHYAYIVGEGSTGLQIADLQYLPDSVRYVGNFNPGFSYGAHTISQSGPYLYLNGGTNSGVIIFDLTSNPELPVVRGKWNQLYIHDSRIENDTIWACNIFDGRVTLIDSRNKDSLREITHFPGVQMFSPHNCDFNLTRTHVYVCNELSDPGRMVIWNIEDLGNITLSRIYIPPLFEQCISHNVEIYGNLLICSFYEGGVRLLDITNPVNFTELGWYDTYPVDNFKSFNGCWGPYMFPSGKIIVSDMQKGLFVLRYSPPENQKPKADFMSAKTTIFNGDSLQFYDCAFNNPAQYLWTFSGPVNFSSTLANPKIKFLSPGYYSVKCRFTNQFGSDSAEKINYINVRPTQLNPFSFSGALNQTIYTNSTDTSKVKFYWIRSSYAPDVRYKLTMRKIGTSSDIYFLSDNEGLDSIITFRKSKLDSIALQFGPMGDSVRTMSKVYAYNSIDSLASLNSLVLNIYPGTVGISNISSNIPPEFKLHNNFPNPFNPGTVIKFDVPENAFISLVLYNAAGKEISRLVNERMSAGYYQFTLNAKNLSSGVYYYSLLAGKTRLTKKMLLIK